MAAQVEQVPQVDPAVMPVLWDLAEDTKKTHPEGGVIVGLSLMRALCTPGRERDRGELPRGQDRNGPTHPARYDGTFGQGQIRRGAQRPSEIPMEWIGATVHYGWTFDPDDFVRRVREA